MGDQTDRVARALSQMRVDRKREKGIPQPTRAEIREIK